MTHSKRQTTGTLYVIAAPSGAGKTSLTRALAQSMPQLQISVSHTTRSKRADEQQGVHYWFVSQDEFKGMIQKEAFLEHAQVFGHYYGTSRQWVEEQLQAGVDVILEIDWQGARQVQLLFPSSRSIFILPPSFELLQQRLETRQQDEQSIIEQRLAGASAEVAHYPEFDYLVVNDVFANALSDLQAIIRANRLKREKQVGKYVKLLAELINRHYNSL